MLINSLNEVIAQKTIDLNEFKYKFKSANEKFLANEIDLNDAITQIKSLKDRNFDLNETIKFYTHELK